MPRGRPRKNPVAEKAAKNPRELTKEEKVAIAESRWRKYDSPDELRVRIDEYFADCDRRGALYGEAGLALWLHVSLDTLHSWYDGKRCPDFQSEAQRAYMIIQNQVETDPMYQDKAMVSRAIFLMKQARYGGKVDKVEAKSDVSVNVKMGKGMDKSDYA